MHLLESMTQHRSVAFLEKLLIDVDAVIWIDPKKVRVVRGVVNLAHTQSVRNSRDSSLV